MDENTSYVTTLTQMPWLVGLGNAHGHTTNYISNTAGSLMDYLWVSSGSTVLAAVIVKVWALEVPPPGVGVNTVTVAVPATAMSAGVIAAVS